jgi:hypothetical protein
VSASTKKWQKANLEPFQQPPDFQSRVNERKEEFIGLDAPELTRAFNSARNLKHGHEGVIKAINIELEALSQLLVEHLETATISKLTLDTGETVFTQSEPYCSVEDEVLLRAWIENNGLEELLSINFRTLNALTKERLIDGKAPPSGVKVFLKTSARIHGGSNGNQE